jgi:hypothetical protein
MKTLIISTLFAIAALAVKAQTDITDQVAGLLKTGNIKELAKHLTDNVDLAVGDYDDIASKAQSEQILKKFFDKNQPKNFTIKHKGKTSLGVEYRIGELETSGGNFRVTFNLKAVGDTYQINLFRVEN